MKARVVIAYGQYSVGHIFTDMPGNAFRALKARNLVVEVADGVVEDKQIQSPADRMMRGGVNKQAKGQRQ